MPLESRATTLCHCPSPNDDSAPVGSEREQTSPPADETTDVGAAAEAPKDEPPALDPEAKNWDTFVNAASDIAQARKVDPEYFDGAMKALKLKTAAASKPTRQGHEFRSDWLGKFAKGAKLGTDGTLA